MAGILKLAYAADCLSTGALALKKLRQGGQQQITVQYVNVSHETQTVIGSVENGRERVVESLRDREDEETREPLLAHLSRLLGTLSSLG